MDIQTNNMAARLARVGLSLKVAMIVYNLLSVLFEHVYSVSPRIVFRGNAECVQKC